MAYWPEEALGSGTTPEADKESEADASAAGRKHVAELIRGWAEQFGGEPLGGDILSDDDTAGVLEQALWETGSDKQCRDAIARCRRWHQQGWSKPVPTRHAKASPAKQQLADLRAAAKLADDRGGAAARPQAAQAPAAKRARRVRWADEEHHALVEDDEPYLGPVIGDDGGDPRRAGLHAAARRRGALVELRRARRAAAPPWARDGGDRGRAKRGA